MPDDLIRKAKRTAIDEETTLTQLIIEGLESRLEAVKIRGPLPVSSARGGLRKGVSWDHLVSNEENAEAYR